MLPGAKFRSISPAGLSAGEAKPAERGRRNRIRRTGMRMCRMRFMLLNLYRKAELL
jgi:hypothetical protein